MNSPNESKKFEQMMDVPKYSCFYTKKIRLDNFSNLILMAVNGLNMVEVTGIECEISTFTIYHKLL